MLKKFKYAGWIIKQWIKKLYIYPQDRLVPGQGSDYDAYWRGKRGNYLGQLGRWQSKRAGLAVAIILAHGGKVVNDIGSGAGEVLVVIKNKVGLESAIAYDSSPDALAIARSKGLITELLDINKENDWKLIKPADFTILFEILEHIPAAEFLLKIAYDQSRKGVLFSLPNTGFIIHRCRLFFFGKFPLQWIASPAEHLRFWTKKDLIWWLKAQGYEKYAVHYYVGVPFLKKIWPAMFAAGFLVEILK